MAVGPIPWTAVRLWARENGVAEVERFEYLIQAMDGAWRDITAAGRSDGKS